MSSGGASRTDVSAAIARRRTSMPVGGPESANWGMHNSLVTARVFWSWLCDEKYSSMRMHVTCDRGLARGGVCAVLCVAGVGAGVGGCVVAAPVV